MPSSKSVGRGARLVGRTGNLVPRSTRHEREELAHDSDEHLPDFVPWKQFLKKFKWKQGEHVTLIGPTGGGKTTLALSIIPRREYMVAFATKSKDESLYPELKRQGFKEIRTWQPEPPEVTPKILLHPKLRDTSDKARNEQRNEFRRALDGIFIDGGWGLYLDELRYISDTLKLQSNLEVLYLQGRSLGVSMVGTSQRPSWIPLVALSQATHLFIWSISDRVDIERVSGASGRAAKTVANVVHRLQQYETLYVNTRTGETMRTKVDL